MPVKTILVALNEVGLNDQLIKASAELGSKFDAHVIGLYVIPVAEVHHGIGASILTQAYVRKREHSINTSKGMFINQWQRVNRFRCRN